MFQFITPPLSKRFIHFFLKNKRAASWCLSVVAILWLAGLHAAPNQAAPGSWLPAATIHAPAPAGDTSITETICANGFYVFNGDTITEAGQYSAVLVAADGTDSIVDLNLVVLPVRTSSVMASICAGSSYLFHGETFSQAGTYEAVLVAANGCDSIITLTLLVKPNASTKLQAGICTGSTYLFQGDTLTESGVYTAVLPAANGCDSIVTLTLQVVPFFDIQLKASICAGEFYVFNGDTLKAGGSYVDSLTAGGGCDSTVTLTLKVLPVPVTQLEVGICTGSEYIFHGDTLDTSGIYTDTLTAANGCDSLVILDLSVVDFFVIAQSISICAGETYHFGGEILNTAGIYVHLLTAAGGCDSTVTLTLTVLPVQTGTAVATICQGDTLHYNGELLTAAGVYPIVLTGANGCDSTVTLTLNVLPTASTALQAKICQGATYVFNGDTLEQSGVYPQVFTAANGCDSTVTLTLTVLPVQHTDITAVVCAGESYIYSNDTLTASGNYPYVYTGANGCDSIVTIALTVLLPQSSVLNTHICAGETYVFDGDTLDQAGTYTATLSGTNACDSMVTLHLEVLPVRATSVTATSCDGTDYLFNGNILTQTGIYTAVLTGVNGCDSTVTLNLTVLPTQNLFLLATTCANEPYPYAGEVITETGSYNFVFPGANGCDSTVTLNLTVLPVFETAIAASICAGEAYIYAGDTLTAGGDYPYVFQAIDGCDSTVTILLTVRPLLSSNAVVNLCAGSIYLFDGDTLTTSGTYIATHPGTNGCDSTATLQLNLVPFFETILEASICNGETYLFGGDSLQTAGTYVASLTAAGGCDSVIILNLTVLPLAASTTNATICPGETYPFNGQSYTASGIYPVKFTGANGCDSTATLVLTVLTVPITNLTATICPNETYPFAGQILSTAGTFTASVTGPNGCDSILVLALTVLPVSSDTLVLSVCAGNSVSFHGDLLTTSGTYEFTFPGGATNGCDSLVVLSLTVLPVIAPTSISATICAGANYDYNGMSLTITGTYTFQLNSVAGCDSTVQLTLLVTPPIVTQFNATICTGDSFAFNGQDLTAAGIYTAQLQSVTGCDSLVTVVLAVQLVNTTVSLQNGTLTAQTGSATYQWINCNGNTPIAGATTNSYTPTVTGEYAVIVTQNSCTGTSTCQLVQVVATNEPLAESSWSVQPNPARSTAVVMIQEPIPANSRLEIYDTAGRLLQKQKVAAGATQIDLDLSGLPDGLLLVRLVNEQGASTKRLLKSGN